MSDDEVMALSAAYVEGDLDPISRSHLAELVQQEPAQAGVLAEQVRTHLLLHALLNGGAACETVRRARLIPGAFTSDRAKRVVDSARSLKPHAPRRSSPRPYATMRWITAAAVAIFAVFVLVLLLPQTSPPQISADAGVRIVRAGNAAVATGELRPNDTIITAANQRAELTWVGEGTRLALEPSTQVQALEGRGKRFRLDHGGIAVRAAPQPSSAPLVLQTARAQATVVGTAFTLNADPFTAWLHVEHGTVRFGLHGGVELQVNVGERALAADRVTIIPRDRGCGLLGAYFRTNHLTDQVLVRLDPVIDFDWASSEPAPGMSHPFSIRWTGFIEAQHAETYRFYVPSDDGVRLWIDDRLVYDNWRIQSFAPEDNRYGVFTFHDDRLRVPIRLEYYEQFSLAAVRLSWQSPNTPREVVPASALYPVNP
jgi:ferric-dicitrate binding protein FerR (iron transport regulator)